MYDLGPLLAPPCGVPAELPENAALFLDFDGTLVDSSPEAISLNISPELPNLLLGLCSRLQGALAIVSGRSLTELDQFLAPGTFAGAGLHGAELRLMTSGPIESSGAPELIRLLGNLRELYGSDNDICVDHANGFVKVCFDQDPARADEIRSAMNRLATARSIEVVEKGRCFEARPRGNGKGFALRMLIEEISFRGRTPVFVGNGMTDEDGFRAASAMGGIGIKIGDGDTAATHRLNGVDDLHAWLNNSLQSLS